MDEVKKYKRISTKEDFISWADKKEVPSSIELKQNNLPWVKWGKDNLYPLFLNTLYARSPSQSGIINSKVYYMTAGGYTITPTVDTPEIQALIKSFERNEPTDFTISDVLMELVRDSELYNQYCIKGKWDFEGNKVVYLEHVNADDIRTNEDESIYYYSLDWSKNEQNLEKTGFKIYQPVDLNKRSGEFIIWIKGICKKTEKGFVKKYPDPNYSGCIESVMAQIEYKDYRLNEVFNGFKMGTIVVFPNPKFETQKDEKEFVETVKHGGTSQQSAGGVGVIFTEGQGNDKPEVLSLNGNDLDKRYLQTEQSVIDSIMTAHSVTTPALFGVRVPGSLGNVQELENGYEIFKKTYITSRQKSFNDTFTWILKNLFGIDAEFAMNQPPPLIGNIDEENVVANELNKMSPDLRASVLETLTTNEKRALAKLEPLPDGDVVEKPEPVFDEHSATDPIIKEFRKVGKKKNKYIIHESRPVPVDCESDWFDTSEAEFQEKIKNEKLFFATLLNENQKNVLKLINDGNNPTEISKALKLPVGDVMKVYNELSKKGLVKKDGTLSESGTKYLNSNEVPADKFEIRYSYETRTDAPKLKGDSRPFCKKMLEMDKLYTREEIDTIGVNIGRDVWKYRGGWYTNPDTEKHTPWCRHNFQQHLVVVKS